MSEDAIGLFCDACRKFIEFELPVTFLSVPLCEACENEPKQAIETDPHERAVDELVRIKSRGSES